MRIVFISHFFAPESAAPAARVAELAAIWARNCDVTVLTGFPNHPTGHIAEPYRGRFTMEERREGYRVRRCWLYATPNEGFLRRTLGHLSFMLTAFAIGAFALERPDVIVVTSPTFFSVFAAWALAVRFRCPFVFEVRDLWPGVFVELGVLRNHHLIRLLEAAELWLYRRAALVVTVTQGFADDIQRRGIQPKKLLVVPNGADLQRFRPGPPLAGVRAALGARGDDFLVLYIGAHGISHALGVILQVAKALRGTLRVRFAFVGDGARKADLVEMGAREGLSNVVFLPAQPRERVADFYNAADLCLVPLRDVPLFSTFIPSKMFEIMACGRPILASVRGEAAKILTASGGAVVVEPEAVEALAEAIIVLSGEAGRLAEMGQSGRRFVVEHFDRERLAQTYLEALEKLAG